MAYAEFDREKTKRLRKAYDRAKAAGQEEFRFEGHDLLTAYAKHLLAYLEPKYDNLRRGTPPKRES